MKNINITKDEVIEISEDTAISVTANANLIFNVKKDAKLQLKIAKDIEVSKVTYFTGKVNKYDEELLLEQGASLDNKVLNIGKDNFKINIDAQLTKDHSSIDSYLVDLSSGKAKKDWFINAVNDSKSTTHDITHYALAHDESFIKVLCNAEMKKGCNGSANTQLLKAIMFSEKADATVDPMLIIDEPDLEDAGHGATIGKLDEEQLYYLRSRGISEINAKKLIINGFFRPIFEVLEGNEILDIIKKDIDAHLKG